MKATGILQRAAALAAITLLASACTTIDKRDEHRFNGPITGLVIDSPTGSVIVRTTKTNEILVRTHSTHFPNKPPALDVGVENGILHAGYSSARVAGQCRVDFEIDVPPGPLAIRSKMGSGDLELHDMTGSLDAVSDSGNVGGFGLQLSDVRVESKSGDINLHMVTPPGAVSVTSDSGDVVVEVPDDRYAVSTVTDSGRVERRRVMNDASSSRTIRIETDSGDVLVLTPVVRAASYKRGE